MTSQILLFDIQAEDRCDYVWCWSVAGPNCKKVEEVDLSHLECGDIKCAWCVDRGVSIYIVLPLPVYTIVLNVTSRRKEEEQFKTIPC